MAAVVATAVRRESRHERNGNLRELLILARTRKLPVNIGVLVIAAAAVAAQSFHTWTRGPIVPKQVDVYFSPKGGATEAIIQVIAGAKTSVHVQAYSFTSPPIAKALVEAKRRGLKVEIILDTSQRTEKYTEADFTSHAGIATWIDDEHAIAHNKLMILDEETVITGSFNFSRSAEERNAENVLILHKTPELARRYMENWHAHRKHSEPYAGR